MSHRWGIDLGGTKVEAAVLDQADPTQVVMRRRLPTEAEKGYEAILARIAELVDLTAREAGVPRPTALGIGTPGSLDPTTGLLRNSNTLCLNGKPFKADLEKILGCRVEIANDANCFALAEALFGAAEGSDTVFGVILGTGVGGGVVVGSRALVGRHGIAGEWGHTVMRHDGPGCYCGKKGCLERLCSGPHLEAYYRELTGLSKSLPMIWMEDSEASQLVEDRLVTVVAEALGGVINLLDPDAIVLGGGVGQTQALYTRLPEELKKWVFHEAPSTPILPPKLGDSAGVFGAALLTAQLHHSGKIWAENR